jgi:hypothetical protein
MELKKYIMTLVAFGLLASNASAHSAGITPKVTEVLVTQYLEIQQALAQDDLEQAKLAANEYRNEEVGLRGGSPLYRVNCPTAFSQQGNAYGRHFPLLGVGTAHTFVAG